LRRKFTRKGEKKKTPQNQTKPKGRSLKLQGKAKAALS
jgi:hypothetical protein